MTTRNCPKCDGAGEFEGETCDFCAGDGLIAIEHRNGPLHRVRPISHRLEEGLADQIRLLGLPEPQREYRFHPTRRWRFDLAWPAHLVAAEIEGGIWIPPDDPSGRRSRHTTGTGFEADCEKYNAATVRGWRVLRFAPSQVHSGYALQTIETLLKTHTADPRSLTPDP